MPLWKIYHPPNTFTTPTSKQSLAQEITALYASFKLPAFYVVVLFHEIRADSIYVSSVPRPSNLSLNPVYNDQTPNPDPDSDPEPSSHPNPNSNPFLHPGPTRTTPFIRITIENIARRFPSNSSSNTITAKKQFIDAIDRALAPHIAAKGYDYEFSVTESDRDLWKINGEVPPVDGDEGLEVWRRENRVVRL